MTTDLLKRELAPILPEARSLVDEEARRILKLYLAGRKVVDSSGPHGWKLAAVNTKRLHTVGTSADGVRLAVRESQPVVEIRAPFRLPVASLDDAARGAADIELDRVRRAAELVARAEDGAIFNGLEGARIRGILSASPHEAVAVRSAADWPRAVVEAKEKLRMSGVAGPFALRLGPYAYDEVSAASEEGYPIRKRIEGKLIDEPIVWAPAIEEPPSSPCAAVTSSSPSGRTSRWGTPTTTATRWSSTSSRASRSACATRRPRSASRARGAGGLAVAPPQRSENGVEGGWGGET